jgi:outer membrane protein assembly factor BamE
MIFFFSLFPYRMMRKSSFFFSLLLSLSLTACSTVLNNLPGVYSIQIQQGNIVNQAMVDQLRPNMSKRQVLYIMGSPMLMDTFHPTRWDYIYSNQPAGEDREQKRISLFFSEDEKVIGIQGDLHPSAVPKMKPSEDVTINVPKRDLDKTLWEKITSLWGFDSSESKAADAKNERMNKPDL